jgi:hypothetical protein
MDTPRGFCDVSTRERFSGIQTENFVTLVTQNDVTPIAVLKGAMTFIPHPQHFDLSLPLKHYPPLPCRCPAHFVFALTFARNNLCLTDPTGFCELLSTLYRCIIHTALLLLLTG